MTRTPSYDDSWIDEVQAMITMPVIGFTIFPGFLLCVPGLLMVILPVVALGLLALATGLVVLTALAPLLIARALVHRVGRRTRARARVATARPLPAPPSGAVILR